MNPTDLQTRCAVPDSRREDGEARLQCCLLTWKVQPCKRLTGIDGDVGVESLAQILKSSDPPKELAGVLSRLEGEKRKENYWYM